MSVEGFIVREDVIWVNKERMIIQNNNDGENLTKYVHRSEEFCIDIWKQDKLLKEMFKFGANDYTNNEYVGIIEMNYDNFYEMVDNSDLDFDNNDYDSIEKIKKYFNENEYFDVVTLSCK